MEEIKPKLKQLLKNGWSIFTPLTPTDLLLKYGVSSRLIYNKEFDAIIAQYSLNYKGDVIKKSIIFDKETVMLLFILRYGKLLCIENGEN